MVLNRENLNALSRSFRALVLEARESYPKLYPLIADEVESTSRVNYYAWLESIPTVREWVGERQVRNLSAQTFAIENQKFEATVEVLRSDVEDDNIGVYARLFRQMGIKAAAHDDRLVFALLKEGFTRKAYDGKPFFANDHRIGRNTFSNRGTAPLSREAFREALASMRSLQDSRGYPLGFFLERPLLIVGPGLASTATEIVGVQTLPGGGANPDYGAAEVLVNPWLLDSYASYWFLVDGSRPIKPLILQRRMDPEWVAKTNPEDDHVFRHNEFVFGVYERKAVGYLYWQLAYGSTGAGS